MSHELVVAMQLADNCFHSPAGRPMAYVAKLNCDLSLWQERLERDKKLDAVSFNVE